MSIILRAAATLRLSRISVPTTRLRVHCGCGAAFDSVDDGIHHAATTGHTLHISGEIRVQK